MPSFRSALAARNPASPRLARPFAVCPADDAPTPDSGASLWVTTSMFTDDSL